MYKWWEFESTWLDGELDALRQAELDPLLSESTDRIVIECDDPTTASERLVIVYPDSFPNTPPQVYGEHRRDMGRHVTPHEGNLCLLGDTAYWSPQMTAAQLITTQLPILVASVAAGPEELRRVEVPQGEPHSTYYTYAPTGAILLPSSALTQLSPGLKGKREVRAPGTNWFRKFFDPDDPVNPTPAVLLSETGDAPNAEDLELADRIGATKTIKIEWASLEHPPSGSSPINVMESLKATFPALQRPKNLKRPTAFGFTFPEETTQGQYSAGWAFLVARWNPSQQGVDCVLIRGLRYTEDDLMSRIEELAPLRKKSAAVVGLGALGSDIAFDLSRSQIQSLAIADYDYHDPAGSVRHHDGIAGAGLLKTQFQAGRLRQQFPFVGVTPHHLQIGAAPLQPPPTAIREATVMDALLNDTDLIIDATADYTVQMAISNAATRAQVPQIFVWGIDGYGGAVVRIRPGESGCLHCYWLRVDPNYDGSDRIAPSPVSNADLQTQPRGCRDLTVKAAGFDLSILSNHAARIAASTLCNGAGSSYPATSHDVWILSLRRPDGPLLDAPEWSGYQLPPHARCPAHCGPKAA